MSAKRSTRVRAGLLDGPRQLPLSVRKKVINRLRRFARQYFSNPRQFGLRIGATTGTTSRWFGPAVSLPDAPFLYRMVTEANLSLDWLMTGEGPEMRGTGLPSGELSGALREAHISMLIQQGVSREDAALFTPPGPELLQRALSRHAKDWEAYSAQVKLRKQWQKRHPNTIGTALKAALDEL